jgi:hypothetical protein
METAENATLLIRLLTWLMSSMMAELPFQNGGIDFHLCLAVHKPEATRAIGHLIEKA